MLFALYDGNISYGSKDVYKLQIQRLVNLFKQEELWVIWYIFSRYQFKVEFVDLFKDVLDKQILDNGTRLFLSQVSCEAIIFNYIKDYRRRKFKGLEQVIKIKESKRNAPYKYRSNLIKGIIGKID